MFLSTSNSNTSQTCFPANDATAADAVITLISLSSNSPNDTKENTVVSAPTSQMLQPVLTSNVSDTVDFKLRRGIVSTIDVPDENAKHSRIHAAKERNEENVQSTCILNNI